MMPLVPPGLQAPSSPLPAAEAIRAQYAWGYVGEGGEGKGLLSVLVEAASGAVIVEVQGLGERLVLLKGDAATGYHLLIPRREVDARAATMADLPIPFIPQLGNPAALRTLLVDGTGPGVQVSKRDAWGPVKLRYLGKDEQGREVRVWLERKLWQPGPAVRTPAP
jgi:hypothetical protein